MNANEIRELLDAHTLASVKRNGLDQVVANYRAAYYRDWLAAIMEQGGGMAEGLIKLMQEDLQGVK
jgi:hypothetical protein